MSVSTWLAFFAASWAISFSPGPGAIAAMAAGLKYGFRRGYWTTAGLILGLLAQFGIVAIGLGAVLATSELAFSFLKWLGAAYLVYLGWQQFRSDAQPVTVEAASPAAIRIRDQVWRGFLVNITNPKGTVFLMAVVPQFMNPAAALATQYAIIAATLCLTDLVAMGSYTALAARMLRMLRTPRRIRWMNRSFGVLFILAGTVLAGFSRRV